jgi:hypothetical protein
LVLSWANTHNALEDTLQVVGGDISLGGEIIECNLRLGVATYVVAYILDPGDLRRIYILWLTALAWAIASDLRSVGGWVNSTFSLFGCLLGHDGRQ